MKNLIDFLDVDMKTKAINLNSLGFNEYAWKFSEAEKILEIATINEWLILGGDVYLIDENGVSIMTIIRRVSKKPKNTLNGIIIN